MLSTEKGSDDDKFLQGQIKRLQSLRLFPEAKEARTELKMALAHAKSTAHAKATVESITKVFIFSPTPFQIFETLEQTPDPAIEGQAVCAQCGESEIPGMVYKPVELGRGAWHYCTCPAGVAKREAARK